MAIPEFILHKLFVQGSLQIPAKGFAFALNNTFAPATLTGMGLEVAGQPVPSDCLTLQAAGVSPARLPALPEDALSYELLASSLALLTLET